MSDTKSIPSQPVDPQIFDDMPAGEGSTPEQPFTFAMIKAPSVQRGQLGEILKNIEARGFIILIAGEKTLTTEQINQIYHQHVERTYFPDIVASVTGDVVGMWLAHSDPQVDVVAAWREALGSTNSRNAAPDTIRGTWGGHRFLPDAPLADNVAHGSDSPEEALRESTIFFCGSVGA